MPNHDLSIAGVSAFHWTPPSDDERTLPNFGDELGPMIVRALLAGSSVPEDREPVRDRRLLSVGSVLHFAEPGDVVWGSGINGKVMKQRFPSGLDVRSVRGPLTRAVLLSRGLPVPEVYGDPALLLRRAIPNLVASGGGGVVVVPNLNELGRFADGQSLSPLGEPAEVIRELARADMIVASSLHALIVADALGIPSRPLRSAAEHPFKYLDYYAGTGRADVVFADSVEEAVRLGPVEELRYDEEALVQAFPWDLWGVDRADGPVATPTVPRTFPGLRAAGAAQRDSLAAALGRTPSDGAAQAIVRLDQLAAEVPHTDGISREDAASLGIALPHLRSLRQREGTVLSVVIPTHNVGPWIRETLESVLAQGVEGMEVLVVDDHSTDRTGDIVARIAERDTRVRWIEATSRGGGSARNIGADHARGRYLIFCDGDDLVPDGAYAALVRRLEASGSDVAFGDYIKFRPSDTWSPTLSMQAYGTDRSGIALADEPSLLYSRPCWNKAFDRGFWESRGIRFPDVPRSNDIVPMTRAYLFARKVDIVPNVVYVYRERPGGSSMTSRADSSVSVLSYLEQELQCAKLVIGAKHQGISRTYSALIWERDTYAHVARYLARWSGAASGDEQVSGALAELLTATPRPGTNISRLKRTVLQLVALGEMESARTILRAGEFVETVEGDELSGWRAAFSALSRHGLSIGDAESMQLPLAAILGRASEPDHADEWTALRDIALELFGRRSLILIPEAALDAEAVHGALQAREAAGARMTVLNGGLRELVLGGMSRLGPEDVRPALHDGEHRGTAHVEPSRVDWERSEDGWRWNAVFPVPTLPLHRPVVPAMRHLGNGVLTTIETDVAPPAYETKAPFLYDRHQNAMMIRRRRHWLPRAGRRAVIVARDRVQRR